MLKASRSNVRNSMGPSHSEGLRVGNLLRLVCDTAALRPIGSASPRYAPTQALDSPEEFCLTPSAGAVDKLRLRPVQNMIQ